MEFGPWDTLFNVILFLFWFQIWARKKDAHFFNPYVAQIDSASAYVTRFLQPVFLGLPARAIAAICFGLLMTIRGLAVPHDAPGYLQLGLIYRYPDVSDLMRCIAAAGLSFAIFLFQLWGAALLYAAGKQAAMPTHAAEALHRFARPLANLRFYISVPLLLLFGMLIVAALDWIGPEVRAVFRHGQLTTALDWARPERLSLMLQVFILAMAGWVDVLQSLVNVMIVIVIGSLVSMFTGNTALAFMCSEWMELLLGPLRRYPLRIGMLDLTPMVAVLAIIYLIHPLCIGLLYNGFVRLS